MYDLGSVEDKLADKSPSTVQQSLFTSEQRNILSYILGAAVLIGFVFPLFSKRRGNW